MYSEEEWEKYHISFFFFFLRACVIRKPRYFVNKKFKSEAKIQKNFEKTSFIVGKSKNWSEFFK